MIGARQGSPLAIGFGDGSMYVGSDAIALAPFTDTVSYLEDGDWVIVRRGGAEIHDRDGNVVQRAVLEIASLGVADRQGQPSPFHGQGNPRAARSRRSHAGELHRHDRRARGAAVCAAVRFRQAQSDFHRRLRHRLLCRHGGALLVRAIRATAGRGRYRLRVSLPRRAARARQSRDLCLAIGRNRRHAGFAALCAGAQAARALDRQCADFEHRARERRRHADARRTGNRRRLDQGLHLPARGARQRWRSPPAAPAACWPRATRRRWCTL